MVDHSAYAATKAAIVGFTRALSVELIQKNIRVNCIARAASVLKITGMRGHDPARASKYGLHADYFQTANENMIYLTIIEDEKAVRNCEVILSTEGVDAFVIGPADLSISLGIPMQADHPKFKEAERTVVMAARAAKKPLGTGIYGGDIYNPDTYKRFLGDGFRLQQAGGDEWLLSAACRKLDDCAESIRK